VSASLLRRTSSADRGHTSN